MVKKKNIKALGLVGSPKGASSNSGPIVDYLLKKLAENGFETELILVYTEHRKDSNLKKLLKKTDEADVVVLAFPLYVDSLPARLIRTFELIHKHRKANEIHKDQRFMAVCQSGFPESHQNELALDMCKNFAEMSGFNWIGGIPIGGGGMIGGLDIEEAGGRLHHIKSALDGSVKAIIDRTDIPSEARDAAAKMPIPQRLYKIMGTLGWNRQARKNGLHKHDLYAKPYARTGERDKDEK